jgi:hypothetical protein
MIIIVTREHPIINNQSFLENNEGSFKEYLIAASLNAFI